MATVRESKKACAVNPLKMSQPLGACYAFMGMESCMPMMHGSQGCTSFGLVLLVRHFREAIPLQTTAMNEVSTILGGMENIESAILNIKKRANPALIAIASTGLTETKGDDVDAYLKLIRRKHGETLAGTEIVYVSTPDYVGAFQDGWARAVTAMVDTLIEPAQAAHPRQVNLLPGCHLTAADIDELRDMIEAFGLHVIVAPDVSGSLDGHMPDDFTPTTLGGTTLEEFRSMASSCFTLAVGEHMRMPAQALEDRSGVPFQVFERVTGLQAVDEFLMRLAELSAQPVPSRYRRARSQLQDLMLDAHFWVGAKKFAIGAEPDLLFTLSSLAAEMGIDVPVAITTTHSPILEKIQAAEVVIGDLEDFELAAKDTQCDLLITHSHGRQAASRLHKPLIRAGLPMFDRLGAAHRLSVGYRGTRELITEWGNTLLADEHHHSPQDWPLPAASLAAAQAQPASCGTSCHCTEHPDTVHPEQLPA